MGDSKMIVKTSFSQVKKKKNVLKQDHTQKAKNENEDMIQLSMRMEEKIKIAENDQFLQEIRNDDTKIHKSLLHTHTEIRFYDPFSYLYYLLLTIISLKIN